MNFRNLFTIHVFEGEESISDIPTELPCSIDLENPGRLPVQDVLMNFRNFFTIHVFKGGESISDIATELPFFGDLGNTGQLPVQEVLMIVSYKFSKFLQYSCFRRQ